MSDNDVELTPEQKLLHAIFAPCTDEEWKAHKTEDVLDRIRKRIDAPDPFRSRIEACGEIRASFDRLWHLVIWNPCHRSDSHDSSDDEVVVDLAFEVAAKVCQMLVDLNVSCAVADSSVVPDGEQSCREKPTEFEQSSRVPPDFA